MRHGKPSFTGVKTIPASAMPEWITQYDHSETGDEKPPESCREQLNGSLKVYSSPLPRAISSASAPQLTPEMTNELLRKAELPVFHIPLLRVSPFQPAAIFRVLRLYGLSPQAESLAATKLRAWQAVELLMNTATEYHQPVLPAGHGIINRLIARDLTLKGWTGRLRKVRGH